MSKAPAAALLGRLAGVPCWHPCPGKHPLLAGLGQGNALPGEPHMQRTSGHTCMKAAPQAEARGAGLLGLCLRRGAPQLGGLLCGVPAAAGPQAARGLQQVCTAALRGAQHVPAGGSQLAAVWRGDHRAATGGRLLLRLQRKHGLHCPAMQVPFYLRGWSWGRLPARTVLRGIHLPPAPAPLCRRTRPRCSTARW